MEQIGQKLMVVVPDGTKLEIGALLLNREKFFVHGRQHAGVTLKAFSSGTLHGKVLTFSNDASALQQPSTAKGEIARDSAGPPVFPERTALSETSIRVERKDVVLTPGTPVMAEVKAGNRQVLEFLLDPLMEMRDEVFHER